MKSLTNKYPPIRAYFYLFFAVAFTTIIIVSSCMNGEHSTQESSGIVDAAKEITNVIIPGAVNEGNIDNFTSIIRKVIGHFGLFFADGIFIYLSAYYFLCRIKTIDDKKWIIITGCLIFDLLIAGTTELIQSFVDQRNGNFTDVFIDFSGAFVGTILTILIMLLINKKLSSKQSSATN